MLLVSSWVERTFGVPNWSQSSLFSDCSIPVRLAMFITGLVPLGDPPNKGCLCVWIGRLRLSRTCFTKWRNVTSKAEQLRVIYVVSGRRTHTELPHPPTTSQRDSSYTRIQQRIRLLSSPASVRLVSFSAASIPVNGKTNKHMLPTKKDQNQLLFLLRDDPLLVAFSSLWKLINSLVS
jgi:hypothetical protein